MQESSHNLVDELMEADQLQEPWLHFLTWSDA